jgi:hypothetical protein
MNPLSGFQEVNSLPKVEARPVDLRTDSRQASGGHGEKKVVLKMREAGRI